MKYLIDTNVCIHFFLGNFNLIDRFETVKLSNCAISEITLAELIFGAENSSNPKINYKLIDKFTERTKILPIHNAISIYAKEKVRLRIKGEMISDFDLLIRSTAISNDLIMVIENLKELKRITNIRIENWVNR
ncbi:MAG: PIN domain-containing protein [Psychroflexus maritimus]